MLGKKDCTREGTCPGGLKDASNIPLTNLQNQWSLMVCLVQKGVMGGKLLQADQHNLVLILFLNLYLSSWEAEGNSVLEEPCPSFWHNRMV